MTLPEQSDVHVRLDLAELCERNVARMHRWHDGGEDWTGADWSNAMCGEAGEAANVVKKLRRIETGLWDEQKYPGDSIHSQGIAKLKGEIARAELIDKLADECADVLCYLGLLADHYGIDLAAATVAKFNRVSEAQGFPERIGCSS